MIHQIKDRRGPKPSDVTTKCGTTCNDHGEWTVWHGDVTCPACKPTAKAD